MHILPHTESLCNNLSSYAYLGGTAKWRGYFSLLYLLIYDQNCIWSFFDYMDSHNNVLLICYSSPWPYALTTWIFLLGPRISIPNTCSHHVTMVRYRPIFLGYYGYDVYYCWFDSDTPLTQFGLKLGYFFCPLWIFFFL